MTTYTPKSLTRFLRDLSTEQGIRWLMPLSQRAAGGYDSAKLHLLCELYDDGGSLFFDLHMQLCDDKSGPEYLLIRFYHSFLDEIGDSERTNFNWVMNRTNRGTILGYRKFFLKYVWEGQQRLLNYLLRSWK